MNMIFHNFYTDKLQNIFEQSNPAISLMRLFL